MGRLGLFPRVGGVGGSRELWSRRLGGYTFSMTSGVSMDEFQALEQRVLRAVEIVKNEREARAAAEAEAASLREQLEAARREFESRESASRSETETAHKILAEAQGQIDVLNQERDSVRQRVEKLLSQMDALG